MNITTGGPHILLFERDQQLVALLASELQLAGYECHAARTAVEVFDAIARYPVRLVLVNLAQAAAARREFWVALDTQRRGRGVQVVTFHCTNLAGYGPSSDDPDERSNSVVADIEVDGMLGIMNMVNTIHSRIAISNTGTMSRLPANANPSSSLVGQTTVPIPSVSPANPTQASNSIPFAGTPGTSPTSTSQAAPPSASIELSRTMTPGHTDKIHAVIYPNQRSWSTIRDNSITDMPIGSNREQQPIQETGWSTRSYPEQVSRFQEDTLLQQHVHPAGATPISTMNLRASPIQDMPIDRIPGPGGQSDMSSYAGVRRYDQSIPHNYAQPQVSQPLMSIATPVSPPQAQSVQPATVNPPAVSMPAPQQDATSQNRSDERYNNTQFTVKELSPEPLIEEKSREKQRSIKDERGFEKNETRSVEQVQTQTYVFEVEEDTGLSELQPGVPDNALLLDIVQSLPPMSSPPPQPQVHNGRATRSLGSVLLEGHLVPQNRLEVAQNIQRMLRGVDMNYQLGEILLMFKLLTPDQLLAASLVSYGLITTTQISSLGRIRQELYAIGLEYDLENLLILFRILTSEQLREVRSNWT
ncbi:MAG: hypothetical protein E6I91_08940 [Chloroflexi bacterium]|nr:MAG: hypothetical protein E6I91_08940 [Chloroflexota bacterium]